MPVSTVSSSVFAKSANVVHTGAGNYNLPQEDVQALYGPGWPVQPIARPEDNELPRVLDYPVGVNYTLQPRTGYEGLMPLKALKAAYTNVPEVAAPVNLIIRELTGFQPMLRDRKTQVRAKDGHPYEWITKSPDRTTPFSVWMSKYKKSSKIYAAPAFFIRREGGQIEALEYIDGSTLFLIINSRGLLPEPHEVDEEIKKYLSRIQYGMNTGDSKVMASMPEIAQTFLKKQQERVRAGKPMATTTPAFTQVIKGVPFSFWDKDQIYFIPEPPAPAVDSPYGESYIERAWSWINIIAVMQAFELGHYRTGNTPEGLMILPKDMFPSMAKLATGEREWNARMAEGSQVQHARNRWMPEGTQYIPTKKPDFPDGLYQHAVNNILRAIGVPASEMGDKPSAGLGGKGFEDGVGHEVTRQLLEGEKQAVEDAFNYVLYKAGVDDVDFYLDYPQEEINPSQQQEDLWNKFSHGIFTLNDVLSSQNKEPIGDPKDPENIANQHLIIAGSTILVVEKMKADESGVVGAAKQPQQPPNAGGSPLNPEDEMLGDKKGLKPDKKKMQELVRKIEESGGRSLSNVTYSFPDPKAFETGVVEETEEHGEHFGEDEIEQIVEDHLSEDPGYYSKNGLVAAGLAVLAEDTGRVLMLQRSDTGQWEFPGGHVEPGEDPLEAAKREWSEETGLVLPTPSGNGNSWLSVDGVYMGFVYPIAAEASLDIHGERAEINPDDPDGDKTESIAWWALDQIRFNPAVRPEVSNNFSETEKAFSRALAKGIDLKKHCGVCEGDEKYAYAPIVRDGELVQMQPEGLASKHAYWLPADGTNSHAKHEAAWLLDQSLGFGLVPLAYVTTTPDGEEGAVLWREVLTKGEDAGHSFKEHKGEEMTQDTSAMWSERAQILSYVLGLPMSDWDFHPDEPDRPLFTRLQNSFQGDGTEAEAAPDFQLSPESMYALQQTLGDNSMWRDLEDLLGLPAVEKAKARLQELAAKV